MKNRSIKCVDSAFKINMGGIILDQALPSHEIDQIDPFLLIHHWYNKYPGGKKPSELGVGPHPHRGFSPVTFIFKGAVHHRDTMGNSMVTPAGGTQWMNSGSGLIHSERPSREIAETGGEFEIIQFWVNSPAARKMDAPEYTSKTAEETAGYVSDDGKVNVMVIAGEQRGIAGGFSPKSDLLIMRMDFETGGVLEIDIPENYSALTYQLEGKTAINGTIESVTKSMVQYNNDGHTISVKALEKTRMILLSGKPIGEKVRSYGPFVMNEDDELRKAVSDFQTGKMGVLTEIFSD